MKLPGLVCMGAGMAGGLCVLAGFHFPWFALPVSGEDAPCTIFWKIALGIALLLTVFAAWKRPRGRRAVVTCSLAVLLALVLFYPCSLLYFAPAHAARANWMQVQHRNITWLGGDVFTSSEIKSVDWKFHVTAVDVPRQVGAVKIPQSIPYLLEIDRLSELVEWLGYSDAFCLFAGKGWLCEVAGLALLIAFTARLGEELHYPSLRLALKAFGATAGVLSILAFVPVFVTAHAIERGREASAEGDDAGAKRWLNAAGAVTPIIRENSYYIIQQGVLDQRLGADTLEAACYQGIRLEAAGFTAQAETSFQELLERVPRQSAIERETLRGLLRAAIHDLDSDQLDHAVGLLEEIVRRDPCSLKAIHCLQFAYLRSNQLADLQASLTSMRQIYAFMGTITKAPVLGSCLENEALLHFLDGDLDAALADRRAAP